MTTDTDLKLGGIRIPPSSMRGLKGEIAPIDNGVIITMMDYSLRDMTNPEGRKFEVSLSTSDMNAPPVFGLWKGSILLAVDVPLLVIEPIEIPQVRPHAPGSLHYLDETEGLEVPAPDAPNRGNYPPAAFRAYYMRLDLMVTEPWKISWDEWEATAGLTLKCREL